MLSPADRVHLLAGATIDLSTSQDATHDGCLRHHACSSNYLGYPHGRRHAPDADDSDAMEEQDEPWGIALSQRPSTTS